MAGTAKGPLRGLIQARVRRSRIARPGPWVENPWLERQKVRSADSPSPDSVLGTQYSVLRAFQTMARHPRGCRAVFPLRLHGERFVDARSPVYCGGATTM